MPRDLQQTDRNEMKIQDAISGSDLVLYYRQPTTPERIEFQKASFQRTGKKTMNTLPEARAEFGARILTGVREGDFVSGTDIVSSDAASPNFKPDWKEQVIATAGDLLMLLGMQMFEGNFQSLMKAAAATVDGDDEDETILPLATSSNG